MDLTFAFLNIFWAALSSLSPLLLTMLTVIVLSGLIIGRLEKWPRLNAVYFAFVTATTVGYGDFRPTHPISRIIAIFIALTGLLLTGFLVSIGVYAVGEAVKEVSIYSP